MRLKCFVSKAKQKIANKLVFSVKMKNTHNKDHIYFMPGMAANPTIFEHIKLPEERYEVHYLKWIPPKKKEPIEEYSKRICQNVKHDNVILIGVSLGGVIVQEMQKFINVKKLVLISSVKTKYELPGFMKFGRKTKLYKLLPTRFMKHYGLLRKLPVNDKIKGRLNLYDHYLGVVDKEYLDWGTEQILLWDREEPIPGIIHIHGDKDKMFPIKYIKDCYVVKGGTHIMIINRFRWFNEKLPMLLERKEPV